MSHDHLKDLSLNNVANFGIRGRNVSCYRSGSYCRLAHGYVQSLVHKFSNKVLHGPPCSWPPTPSSHCNQVVHCGSVWSSFLVYQTKQPLKRVTNSFNYKQLGLSHPVDCHLWLSHLQIYSIRHLLTSAEQRPGCFDMTWCLVLLCGFSCVGY